LLCRKGHLADPRKIVFLTAIDRLVDHQLLLSNVASTELSKSLLLRQPAIGWRLGGKGIQESTKPKDDNYYYYFLFILIALGTQFPRAKKLRKL